MKKTLDTLIRLKRTQIDALRQSHNRLLDAQDQQYQAIDTIAANLAYEKTHSISDISAEHTRSNLGNFGSFSQRMRNQREKHQDNLKELNPQIEESQRKLTEVFAERKRFEIIKDNLNKKEIKAQETKQQQEVDELVVVRYQYCAD